jgi:hypothetical protein
MHVFILTCYRVFIGASIYLQSDKKCGYSECVLVFASVLCVPHNPLVITVFSSPSCCVLMDLLMHDVISPHIMNYMRLSEQV